ncbi:MAG: thermonuclease family protein [Lautropia sp.]|nr:thermonuclease family protein [Lautropia sp.]
MSAGTSAAKPTHAATQKTQQNASWVSARLQRVQDGDSLLVTLGDGQTEKLRIAGIDAPERTQPFSGRSRKHLLSLLEARPLRYRALKRDQYGRQIVILHSQQGKQRIDVNRAMLEAGMAWYFRRYERELPAELRSPYARAETEARRHRRGLWSESSPQPPWEFRRQKRRRNTTTSTGTKP